MSLFYIFLMRWYHFSMQTDIVSPTPNHPLEAIWTLSYPFILLILSSFYLFLLYISGCTNYTHNIIIIIYIDCLHSYKHLVIHLKKKLESLEEWRWKLNYLEIQLLHLFAARWFYHGHSGFFCLNLFTRYIILFILLV